MRGPRNGATAWASALAVAGFVLAGCVGDDAGTNPSGAASSPPSSGTVHSTGGVKEFHVNVTENGFKEQHGRELTVKRGDPVRILLHHAEPYGDDHPIYFTCTERSATVTSTSGPAEMAFVAGEAGTCSFFCTNHDCGPHDALQGGKLVVQG